MTNTKEGRRPTYIRTILYKTSKMGGMKKKGFVTNCSINMMLKSKCIRKACVHACLVGCSSLQHHGLQLEGLFCPQDCPNKDTEVGCHFLLQGIFPTQGWNLCLCLLHLQADSLLMHHLGNRIEKQGNLIQVWRVILTLTYITL